jgi:transcriptional regulator with XRE-family HTH domain
MPVPAKLKAMRERKLLTQEELAKKAGLHVKSISRLESGGNAEFKTIRALAQALAVEPQELLADE